MKCEYCGQERSWGGVACCEKEAEGWANMALKRAPMTEQEELETVDAECWAAVPEELRDFDAADAALAYAAREILALRKRVAELENKPCYCCRNNCDNGCRCFHDRNGDE